MTSSAALAAALTSGLPAKVEPWSPGREDVGVLRRGDERADRQPAAEALGQRHHVREDPVALVGEQRAGAPHPGLDLVDDQQRAVLVAGGADLVHELDRQRVHAGLALDQLDHDARGVGPDGGRRRLGQHGVEAGDERGEGRLLGLLRRRRQRAVGAAVEAAVEDDEAPALAALAGELERRLVGLGAGVGRRTPCRRASAPPAARPAGPSARCRRGWRRAAAARPAPARRRRPAGGSGPCCRPRSR